MVSGVRECTFLVRESMGFIPFEEVLDIETMNMYHGLSPVFVFWAEPTSTMKLSVLETCVAGTGSGRLFSQPTTLTTRAGA